MKQIIARIKPKAYGSQAGEIDYIEAYTREHPDYGYHSSNGIFFLHDTKVGRKIRFMAEFVRKRGKFVELFRLKNGRVTDYFYSIARTDVDLLCGFYRIKLNPSDDLAPLLDDREKLRLFVALRSLVG